MDTKHMYATMKPNPTSVASAAPLSASPNPSAAPTMSVGALNMPPARMNAMLVQLLRSDSSMRRPSASAAAVVSRAVGTGASSSVVFQVVSARKCSTGARQAGTITIWTQNGTHDRTSENRGSRRRLRESSLHEKPGTPASQRAATAAKTLRGAQKPATFDDRGRRKSTLRRGDSNRPGTLAFSPGILRHRAKTRPKERRASIKRRKFLCKNARIRYRAEIERNPVRGRASTRPAKGQTPAIAAKRMAKTLFTRTA